MLLRYDEHDFLKAAHRFAQSTYCLSVETVYYRQFELDLNLDSVRFILCLVWYICQPGNTCNPVGGSINFFLWIGLQQSRTGLISIHFGVGRLDPAFRKCSDMISAFGLN